MMENSDVILGFKPCYKWNTFNTSNTMDSSLCYYVVLNLVISGIPSIPCNQYGPSLCIWVLNLVISGIPSIRTGKDLIFQSYSFKPCYKWNTFNTSV